MTDILLPVCEGMRYICPHDFFQSPESIIEAEVGAMEMLRMVVGSKYEKPSNDVTTGTEAIDKDTRTSKWHHMLLGTLVL